MVKGTKLLDMVSSSVKQAATSLRLRNIDAEFVREAKYFSDLSEKLCVMEKVGNRLHEEREELLASQEDFSTVVFQWSMLEPKITQPLQKLANCVDNCNTTLKSLVSLLPLLVSPSLLTFSLSLCPSLSLSPSSPPPKLHLFSSSCSISSLPLTSSSSSSLPFLCSPPSPSSLLPLLLPFPYSFLLSLLLPLSLYLLLPLSSLFPHFLFLLLNSFTSSLLE